jgi:hypothetical protein
MASAQDLFTGASPGITALHELVCVDFSILRRRRRQQRQPIEMVVQTNAANMIHRPVLNWIGSGYRIEHHMAGIDEIVQIFNLHREV